MLEEMSYSVPDVFDFAEREAAGRFAFGVHGTKQRTGFRCQGPLTSAGYFDVPAVVGNFRNRAQRILGVRAIFRVVVAVGRVEDVDVVARGTEAFLDDFVHFLQSGGRNRAARSLYLEKFFFGKFPRF